MTTNIETHAPRNIWRIIGWGSAVALILTPLVAMQFTSEVNWDETDFIFNAIGIPLAAAGLLSPVIAGAAMALSSVTVVSNALLLRRWRPSRAKSA